jgi:hypothetical protein
MRYKIRTVGTEKEAVSLFKKSWVRTLLKVAVELSSLCANIGETGGQAFQV